MSGPDFRLERRATGLARDSLDSLPPPDTSRWVARRKAQVVAAVQAGRISLDEAMIRYRLTIEEFVEWQRALYRHGVRGLQVTHRRIRKLAGGRRRGRSQRLRGRHA
jgi:hypothetical protein